MRNIIALLGLAVSFAVLAGCASKACEQPAPAAPVVVHHDVKGEITK